MSTEEKTLVQDMMSYYKKLQSKLNDSPLANQNFIYNHKVENIQVCFRMLCEVVDAFLNGFSDIQQQYKLIEQCLQKAEEENRKHIRIEQQMRLLAENLQQKIEDLEKELNYKNKHINQLVQEKSNSNQAIPPKGAKLKIPQNNYMKTLEKLIQVYTYFIHLQFFFQQKQQKKPVPFIPRPQSQLYHTLPDSTSPIIKNYRRSHTSQMVHQPSCSVDLQQTIKVKSNDSATQSSQSQGRINQILKIYQKAQTKNQKANYSQEIYSISNAKQIIRKKNISYNSFDWSSLDQN